MLQKVKAQSSQWFVVIGLPWTFIASDAERSEAISQESFFPQSYGTYEKHDISETIDF